MPGIVGLITKKPRECAERELSRMIEAIRHESFYTTGTWIDESLGVYVGWVARRNAFADGMPLRNETGEVILAFAGEEYPDPATKARLKANGHGFESAGPSYLVHLYEDEPSFPASLNGRFQGIVVDRARATITLFNDRYGMHRVYYHDAPDAFYFAVEAKAILAVRPELRKLDNRGLGELVSCGCVLENRTLFEGIQLLPPASAWVFQDRSLKRKTSYFQPKEWEEQEPLEPETYYQRLREVFSRNLPRYFNGREQIGMSLTGGLDGRMIMAWQKSPQGSLPCYSFAGMFRDCEDVTLARKVARICGQPHQVIDVGEEFLSHFARYAERSIFLTDGYVSVKFAPDLYANERAAAIAPVRMTGNYGSEVVRRLRAFKPVRPTGDIFRPEFANYVRAAEETYERLIDAPALTFIAFRQSPWHHYNLLGLEQTQLTLRSPYLDNDLVQTVFRAPNSANIQTNIFEDSRDCSRLIEDGNAALGKLRTDRGLGGAQGSLSRTLSRSWLEFTFKAEYAYDYGMPQWLARIDHGLSGFHLERLFLGRHKFNHFRVWYRDQLSSYVRDMLLDPRTLSRPYVSRNGIEAAVKGHLKGDRNYTTQIHQLLSLELLHRLFID